MKGIKYGLMLAALVALTACNNEVERKAQTYRNPDTIAESPIATSHEENQGDNFYLKVVSGQTPLNKERTNPPQDTIAKGAKPEKVEEVTGQADYTKVELIEDQDGIQCYYYISGRSKANDTEVWHYKSKWYGKELFNDEEPLPVYVIPDYNGTSYLCEQGIITAIETATGNVRWVNTDFYSEEYANVSGHATASNGHLYLCGYYGPQFMELDSDGRTIQRMERLLGRSYDNADSIAIDKEERHITIGYALCQESARVDLTDYSISLDLSAYNTEQYRVINPGDVIE